MSPDQNIIRPLDLLRTIVKFLEYMANVETCSPLTIKAYHLDLKQAFGPLAPTEQNLQKPTKMHRDQLTDKDLLAKARLALSAWGELSPASRNRKSSTLKSFFNYLFQERLIESDLASQIHSPKVPKKIPHFLSVDEILSILHSFDQDPEPQDLQKLLFLLLYGTGLRVSEASRLRWTEVDLDRRVLRIKGKGSKERLVAFPKTVREILARLQAKKNDASVWGPEGLSTRKAYDWIRQRGVLAGLMKPIHPHALRHSFATHLLASGANMRSLQELLGHESLQATERYTHLGVDQLARTMEKHHPFGDKRSAFKKTESK